MNNEKISGFKRIHAGGDEKLVVNKVGLIVRAASAEFHGNKMYVAVVVHKNTTKNLRYS